MADGWIHVCIGKEWNIEFSWVTRYRGTIQIVTPDLFFFQDLDGSLSTWFKKVFLLENSYAIIHSLLFDNLVCIAWSFIDTLGCCGFFFLFDEPMAKYENKEHLLGADGR